MTPGVGTKWYKAPEIIFGNKHYDKSVDIWSFGCLMAEMFLLEPLFPGSTDFEMINLIFSFIGFSKEDEAVLKPQLHINYTCIIILIINILVFTFIIFIFIIN